MKTKISHNLLDYCSSLALIYQPNVRQKTAHDHFWQGLAVINLDVSGRYADISHQVSHCVSKLESVQICGAAKSENNKKKLVIKQKQPHTNEEHCDLALAKPSCSTCSACSGYKLQLLSCSPASPYIRCPSFAAWPSVCGCCPSALNPNANPNPGRSALRTSASWLWIKLVLYL